MKNAFIAALMLVATIGIAQEKKEGRAKAEKRVEMSAEQRADLKLKKMTLRLDLNASQQAEMKKIIAEQQANRTQAAAKRKEFRDKKSKPTADEMYAMQSKRLDNQIELRAKMKQLLNQEQFAKWEKMAERKSHAKHRSQKRHRKMPEPQRQPQK